MDELDEYGARLTAATRVPVSRNIFRGTSRQAPCDRRALAHCILVVARIGADLARAGGNAQSWRGEKELERLPGIKSWPYRVQPLPWSCLCTLRGGRKKAVGMPISH
jgi:hypothetical protein